jgi:8-oxo-dGTP diphosphatase
MQEKLEVAMALLQQDDDYLLQLRKEQKDKGAANMIGMFGGIIESDEAPLAAVCREVGEETNLRPRPSNFEELGLVKVVSDRDSKQIKVHAHVFKLIITAGVQVEALDGQLVRMSREDSLLTSEKMTPATWTAFERLL